MARSTRRLALTSAGAAYLEKCRVILNLVEAAEADVAEERLTPRGNIRISLPLSFGIKRLAPLLLDFSQRHPEVSLDMDYSDRRINLIEEGIDLAIRITRGWTPATWRARSGASRMLVVAAPDYLARHGRPQHPAELRITNASAIPRAARRRAGSSSLTGSPRPSRCAAGSTPTMARC
jgi:DNA-binding transcriptional LysR family regulator